MENNKLYNNIITGISKSLKDVLDETLTTHPFNKIRNYLYKLTKKYDVTIVPEFGNYEKLTIEDLNENNFDDIELKIVPNNVKIDLNSTIFNNIKTDMQLPGYFFSKEMFGDVYHNGQERQYFIFSPNKQNTIKIPSKIINGLIYHVCPKNVVDKIKKIGFVPKAKNKLFNYDPRIHFFFSNTPLYEIKRLVYQLKDLTHKDYSLITVNTEQMKNIIFYKDIDEEYGIFTKNNISPKYIESIEDIDGNITDYIRIKLKNFNI